MAGASFTAADFVILHVALGHAINVNPAPSPTFPFAPDRTKQLASLLNTLLSAPTTLGITFALEVEHAGLSDNATTFGLELEHAGVFKNARFSLEAKHASVFNDHTGLLNHTPFGLSNNAASFHAYAGLLNHTHSGLSDTAATFHTSTIALDCEVDLAIEHASVFNHGPSATDDASTFTLDCEVEHVGLSSNTVTFNLVSNVDDFDDANFGRSQYGQLQRSCFPNPHATFDGQVSVITISKQEGLLTVCVVPRC
jgi:hypothetical protein